MSDESKPVSDAGSPLDTKAKDLRRNWFHNLPRTDQDGVIQKEFDKRYPTDSKKRNALSESNNNYVPF